MNSYIEAPNRQKIYIQSTSLGLLTLATAFFPRVLTALGAPSLINFLHFILATVLFVWLLPKIRSYLSLKTVGSLFALFGIISASAVLNRAGVINIFLDFLLLAEPFMLLLAIINARMSPTKAEQLQTWLTRFALINLFFGLFQALILRPLNPDDVKGVFIAQGAGHVVGASVSMTFAIYYFVVAKAQPFWLRTLVVIAALVHTARADAKQVLFVFLAALVILMLLRLQDIGKVLQYLLITATGIGAVIWAANTVLPAIKHWFDISIITEGFNLKYSGFSIITSYYHSPLNWWLGLGPGHTIGRLGGWLVWDYIDLLGPLGVTTSPASKAVWSAVAANWLGDKSSMWSPLFSWAGVWGDLGLLGLGVYVYLWFLVWHHLCSDDLSRFLLLTVFVFGLIFSQLEEPGYMLFVISIIGSHWQGHCRHYLVARDSIGLSP